MISVVFKDVVYRVFSLTLGKNGNMQLINHIVVPLDRINLLTKYLKDYRTESLIWVTNDYIEEKDFNNDLFTSEGNDFLITETELTILSKLSDIVKDVQIVNRKHLLKEFNGSSIIYDKVGADIYYKYSIEKEKYTVTEFYGEKNFKVDYVTNYSEGKELLKVFTDDYIGSFLTNGEEISFFNKHLFEESKLNYCSFILNALVCEAISIEDLKEYEKDLEVKHKSEDSDLIIEEGRVEFSDLGYEDIDIDIGGEGIEDIDIEDEDVEDEDIDIGGEDNSLNSEEMIDGRDTKSYELNMEHKNRKIKIGENLIFKVKDGQVFSKIETEEETQSLKVIVITSAMVIVIAISGLIYYLMQFMEQTS